MYVLWQLSEILKHKLIYVSYRHSSNKFCKFFLNTFKILAFFTYHYFKLSIYKMSQFGISMETYFTY